MTIDPFFHSREFKPYLVLLALTGIVTIIASVGCNPIPGPVPTVIELKAPPVNDDETILAVEIAEQQDSTPTPDNGPTPTVKVGDKCPECNGTGQFDGDKDGRPDGPCNYCEGDGTVHDGDPILVGSATGEHSIVVPPLTRAEFDSLVDQTNKLASAINNWTENFGKELDSSQARINELQAQVEGQEDVLSQVNNRVVEAIGAIEKFSKTLEEQKQQQAKASLPSQEKPVVQATPTPSQAYGHWKIREERFCPGNGRPCITRKVRVWVPANHPTSKSTTGQRSGYPIRPSRTYWTGCSSWVHMTQGEHHNQFNYDWLRSLSWAELQSLHSDAHEGRVNWNYAKRY